MAVAPQADRARAPAAAIARTALMRTGRAWPPEEVLRVLIGEISFAFMGWNGMIVPAPDAGCPPCVTNEG
ncbi:hypothetical protein GCM10027039_28950 [Terrabacter koreensis]